MGQVNYLFAQVRSIPWFDLHIQKTELHEQMSQLKTGCKKMLCKEIFWSLPDP